MTSGILISVTNIITKNIYRSKKLIKNIDRFHIEFQKSITNSDFYYILKFSIDNNKLLFYLVNIDSIELLDNTDVNFLKSIINSNPNYNINKIIEKFKRVPNNDLDEEKINLIRGTLIFIDTNPYYNNFFNNIIQKELTKLNKNDMMYNSMTGGEFIDKIKSLNTPSTELILGILSSVPINQNVYNVLNLILSISNLDKKGIALAMLGFIPGYVGKVIKFANLLRLTYKYYSNETK